MTPAQCRNARSLLHWTPADLARAAGVSIIAVRDFESEKPSPRPAEFAMMRRALQGAGITFDSPAEGQADVRVMTSRP